MDHQGKGNPVPGHSTADSVREVTLVGLVVNILLSVLKAVAGFFANSQALVADAVHSLSDSSTDFAVLIGVSYWTAPADEDHPHGHRRIETLISLFIGLTLALVACALIYRAIVTLGQPHGMRPGWGAFTVAVVSMIAKELLFRQTARVARRIKSAAVMANAWHHRSDAFSSVPVALAVLGNRLFPKYAFLDHIAAIAVSCLLAKVAWDIAWPALQELVDTGADDAAIEAMVKLAEAVPGVEEVHALRSRRIGPGLHVDLHVHVDPEMTVHDGHEIATAVQQALITSGPDVLDVLVHVEPSD